MILGTCELKGCQSIEVWNCTELMGSITGKALKYNFCVGISQISMTK